MTKSRAGIAVVALALLAGAGGLCYRYLAPQGAATATPQVVPGSPRSVVYDLLQGMRDGEAEPIRRSLYTRDAHEIEAVGALVEYSEAASRLRKTADAAFGTGRLSPPGLPLARVGLEAQVARLNEIVDKELADVDFNPSSNPSTFHLKKIEGRWWVMVRPTFEPQSEETGPLADMVQALRIQVNVFSKVRSDIEGGKLATVEAAQAAMNRQLAEAFRSPWYGSIWSRYPTTAPARWPTSAPAPAPAPAPARAPGDDR